jgi:hypothetical protein
LLQLKLKDWMPSSSISEIHAAWRELGFLPAACAVISLGSAVLGALFWPLFRLLLLWNVVLESLPVPQGTGEFLHSTLWCFNAFFGAFAVFAAIGIGMRRQKLGQLWPWLLLWPAYQALITVAAWRAGIELWRDPFG